MDENKKYLKPPPSIASFWECYRAILVSGTTKNSSPNAGGER